MCDTHKGPTAELWTGKTNALQQKLWPQVHNTVHRDRGPQIWHYLNTLIENLVFWRKVVNLDQNQVFDFSKALLLLVYYCYAWGHIPLWGEPREVPRHAGETTYLGWPGNALARVSGQKSGHLCLSCCCPDLRHLKTVTIVRCLVSLTNGVGVFYFIS